MTHTSVEWNGRTLEFGLESTAILHLCFNSGRSVKYSFPNFTISQWPHHNMSASVAVILVVLIYSSFNLLYPNVVCCCLSLLRSSCSKFDKEACRKSPTASMTKISEIPKLFGHFNHSSRILPLWRPLTPIFFGKNKIYIPLYDSLYFSWTLLTNLADFSTSFLFFVVCVEWHKESRQRSEFAAQQLCAGVYNEVGRIR